MPVPDAGELRDPVAALSDLFAVVYRSVSEICVTPSRVHNRLNSYVAGAQVIVEIVVTEPGPPPPAAMVAARDKSPEPVMV